jgi:hypothetical protein
LVSDIPAGDGKIVNLFLQCSDSCLIPTLNPGLCMEFDVLDNFDLIFIYEGRSFYSKHAVSTRTSLNFVFFYGFLLQDSLEYCSGRQTGRPPTSSTIRNVTALTFEIQGGHHKIKPRRTAFKYHHQDLLFLLQFSNQMLVRSKL